MYFLEKSTFARYFKLPKYKYQYRLQKYDIRLCVYAKFDMGVVIITSLLDFLQHLPAKAALVLSPNNMCPHETTAQ